MTTQQAVRRVLVVCLILLDTVTLLGQLSPKSENQVRLKPEDYKQRRALLMAKMEPNSIAIFKAKDPNNRSNDVNYLYRQESNFLYLTGCNEHRSYLLLCPDGIQVDSVTTAKEVFFIRPRARSAAGESLGLEGATSELGFAVVLPGTELLSFTKKALAGKKLLYYSPGIPDLAYDPLME